MPIAEEVARLCDPQFEHPVAVDFLSGAEFDERVTVDPATLSEDDEEDLEQINGIVRRLGLGAGDVDFLESSNAANSAGVLAYYDPESERIVVSGEELDVALEVTIADELVHVLQDQHFDLERLADAADDSDTGESSAWDALIEGDAERLEEAYVEQLSDADRQVYEGLEDSAREDWSARATTSRNSSRWRSELPMRSGRTRSPCWSTQVAMPRSTLRSPARHRRHECSSSPGTSADPTRQILSSRMGLIASVPSRRSMHSTFT